MIAEATDRRPRGGLTFPGPPHSGTPGAAWSRPLLRSPRQPRLVPDAPALFFAAPPAPPCPAFVLPVAPFFAWAGSGAGGRPSGSSARSPSRSARIIFLSALAAGALRDPPHPCPRAPPTRPIHRFDLALDHRLLTVSSVPYSTTWENRSPRSTATVDSWTGVPEKSRAPRTLVPASKNVADRTGTASASQGRQGGRVGTDHQVSGCADINRHQKPRRDRRPAGGAIDHLPTPGRRRRPGNPVPRSGRRADRSMRPRAARSSRCSIYPQVPPGVNGTGPNRRTMGHLSPFDLRP